MHILKPPWIRHTDEQTLQRKTIYSIALHPDGSKLATGSIDKSIKIWSTLPVYQLPASDDGKGIRPLATLTAHAGPVMCVRFDNRGRLASGSDDSSVIVWEQQKKGPLNGVTGNGVQHPAETWVALKTLGGHVRDVVGVAWSEDGGFLASCGIDGQVFVYNGTTFDTIVALTGHSSMVKGLCWDPVGEFLATQSSDRSIKIWNTRDWSEATTITTPFEDAPNANFFTRLSWSPCGTYIVAPNATNNRVFVSSVISRGKSGEDWDANISLVGHEDIVDVASFNPLIFLKDPTGIPNEGSNFTSVLCLGSAAEVSFWITMHNHGVGVFRDLFDGEVLDLAWSPDGYALFVAASDGWTAVFKFQRDELPQPAPQGTRETYLAEYGFDPSFQNSVPVVNVPMAVDPSNRKSLLSTSTKRRVPLSNQPQNPHTPPVAVPSAPAMANSNGALQTSSPPMDFQAYLNSTQPLPFIPPPQLPPFPFANYPYSYPPPFTQPEASGSRKRNAEVMEHDDTSDVRDSLYDNPDMKKHVLSALDRGKGRVLGGDKQREPPPEKAELKPAYLPVREDEMFARLKDGETAYEALSVPAIRTHMQIMHYETSDSDRFDVRNFSDGKRSEVALLNSAGRLYFIDYLPSYVVSCTSNPAFSVVSCEDSTIHIYSPAGRRLLPNLVLDSPAAYMDSSSFNLMVITARGTVHSWDIRKSKAIHAPASVKPLLTSSRSPETPTPTIVTAKARRNGYPVVILSSGVAYTFDDTLQSWITLTGLWWSRGSEYWEGRGREAKANSVLTSKNGVLKNIEQEVNDIMLNTDAQSTILGPRSDESFTPPQELEGETTTTVGSRDDFRNALSLGHLESRMTSAVILSSPSEFKVALLLYAKRLAEEGFRNKAEEFIRELMGPVFFKPAREETWVPTILDFNKRDLLKEVLGIFNKSRLLGKLASDNLDLLKKITQDSL